MKYSTTSLQDLCLSEVTKYLEYYPHELLACLPPTLRRPLLVHMPIVDLCQLENTCVFDGVDAEMVWKERLEEQVSRYTSSIATELNAYKCGLALRHYCIVNEPERLLDRHKTMRDKYFAAIIHAIFECARPTGYYQYYYCRPYNLQDTDLNEIDHPVDVVNYLVAAAKIDRVHITRPREPSDKSSCYENPVPEYELRFKYGFGIGHGTPLNYCTYMNTNDLYQEVPPRYSSYLNEENHCRLSEEDALTLLMEKCDYYARDMYINVLRCGGIRWNWEDDRIKSLVGRFFSKRFKLEVCCYSVSEESDCETDRALKDIMEAILSSSTRQLFSLTISDARDDHIFAIAPLLSHPNAPCRLEELHIKHSHFFTDGANAFGDIFLSQSTLSSLEVFLLPCSTSDSRFVTGIINFLQRPNFKHLFLKYTFSNEVVQTLIATFLTTPCSQDQSFQLECYESLTDSFSDIEQKLDIPQSALEYKSLEVLTTGCTTIIPWLLSLQPLKLKSLFITSLRSKCRTLALAANNTNLHVSHLHLEVTDFCAESFQTLLQKRSLKEVEIVSYTGTIHDITHGLLKVIETGTLEKLTVSPKSPFHQAASYDTSNPPSRAEVEQFSETLFSLPHLEHFSLELSICFFQGSDITDFFETMFKIWKRKNKRQRLKRFVLRWFSRRRAVPPSDDNSNFIAEEIGMEVYFK